MQALPWLNDEDRYEAVHNLNERAGFKGSDGLEMERITLEDFRREIGAPPAPPPPKEKTDG